MGKIEERADKMFWHIDFDYKTVLTRNKLTDYLREAYVRGAKDQERIDVERMKLFLEGLTDGSDE